METTSLREQETAKGAEKRNDVENVPSSADTDSRNNSPAASGETTTEHKAASAGVSKLYAETTEKPEIMSDSENEVERTIDDEKYRIELQDEAKRMRDLYDSWPYDNEVNSYAAFSRRRRSATERKEQSDKRREDFPKTLFLPDYYRLLPVSTPQSPTDSEGYVYG